MQVTKNFHSSEISCPCCGGLVYDPHFFELIQIVRTVMNIPFKVPQGGGYRCRMYNDSLDNSAKDSRHLHGSALDFSIVGWGGALEWKCVFEAMKLGLSVGHYKTYLHIDLRPGSPVLFP